jgi:hypothetical protein
LVYLTRSSEPDEGKARPPTINRPPYTWASMSGRTKMGLAAAICIVVIASRWWLRPVPDSLTQQLWRECLDTLAYTHPEWSESYLDRMTKHCMDERLLRQGARPRAAEPVMRRRHIMMTALAGVLTAACEQPSEPKHLAERILDKMVQQGTTMFRRDRQCDLHGVYLICTKVIGDKTTSVMYRLDDAKDGSGSTLGLVAGVVALAGSTSQVG